MSSDLSAGVIRPADRFATGSGPGLTIGLVNNMRGAGFRNSDRQFGAVLAACSVVMRRYTLGPPPEDAAADYRALSSLDQDGLDGLIITGAEPVSDDLRDEAGFPALTRLIDRALSHRIPVLFSCLATHVAVLHISGIARRRLSRKCHGVFAFTVRRDHPLMSGAGPRILVPHSRWNGLDEGALHAAGYDILTDAPNAGVDRFVHPDAPGCVFLQGHPEYEAATLYGEYRRDVKRFIAGEAGYPTIPAGSFDPPLLAAFAVFETRARRADVTIGSFPQPMRYGMAAWHCDTAQFYRNWLEKIAALSGNSPPTRS